MARIVIGKNECQIMDEYDISFLKELDELLSFDIQGAEHSPAYKAGAWDGKKRLLTKVLKFPAGLTSKVEEFYKEHNKDIEIHDSRIFTKSKPLNIIPALKKQGKKPYYYQLDAVEIAKNKSHGIIRAGTGAGKSILAALLIAKLNKPTVVYVIGKDLLHQLHGLFSSLFKQPIGIIGDGQCEIHNINIATIWTVGHAIGLKVPKADEEDSSEKSVLPEKYKDIRNMMGKMKVHLMDECHLAACDTVQEISKKINPEHVYGMSASPWRDDGADLLIEAFLGPKIVNISARSLVKEGFLVPPIIRFLPVPKYPYKSGQYQTIYKKYIVENVDRNNMILKGVEKLIEQNHQVLVLFNSIKHGDILYKLISEKVKCEILSGKDSKARRDEVKQQLESGVLQCVLASRIFDIGIDLPSLNGLIIGSAGKSSVRALQRIGRVIRKYEGKTHAAVIDFMDQAPYLINHSKIRHRIYSEEFEASWPKQK